MSVREHEELGLDRSSWIRAEQPGCGDERCENVSLLSVKRTALERALQSWDSDRGP